MSWKTVLNLATKAATSSKPALGFLWGSSKTAAKGATDAALHPVRTVRGVAGAGMKAVVAGTTGHLAWEALMNDKPVVDSAMNLMIGEERTGQVEEMVDKTVETVSDIKNTTSEAISNMSSSVSSINSTLGGFQKFLSSLFSGNGLGSISNFFDNIGKGNVSGLSLGGLLAAGFLIFGRFGWLGKIAGLLMSMMIIGNNSNVSQQETQQRSVNTQQQTQSSGMRR